MLFACRLWNTEAQGSNETRGQRGSLITEVRWEATEEFQEELAGIFAFKICLCYVVQTSRNLWSSSLRLLSTGSQERCTMGSAECTATLGGPYKLYVYYCMCAGCVRESTHHSTCVEVRAQRFGVSSCFPPSRGFHISNSGLQTCIANAFTNSNH